jgi:outer membrane protein TolC
VVSSALLRAQVERSRLADFLAEARGQARLAETALSFRLAADLDSRWLLAALPDPRPLDEGPGVWLDGSGGRGDLAAAREMVAAATLETRAQRAAARPRVGLVARYDLYDEPPFGSHGQSSAVIAQASFDLFAGGRHRAAAAAAAAEAEAAASDLARFADGVELEVRQAWERARTARERHATSHAALAAARETERITEERFRQGVMKTLDVLDAATARREAETRELLARADAHLAALELATTAGRGPETALAGTASTTGVTP